MQLLLQSPACAACRGGVERVSRRWRRAALSVPAGSLAVDAYSFLRRDSQVAFIGSEELPPEQLGQRFCTLAACLRGRRFLSVQFEWSASHLDARLWQEVGPVLAAARE